MTQMQRPTVRVSGLSATPDMVSNYHDAMMERMGEVGQSVNKLAADFTLFRNEDWVRLLLDVGRLSGRVDGQQEKLEAHITETKSGISHWITFGIALAGALASVLFAHLGKH